MARSKTRSPPDPRPEPQWTPHTLWSCVSAAKVSLDRPQVQPSLLVAIFIYLLSAFPDICVAAPPRPAGPPLLSGQPFIIFWGVPDSSCPNRPDPRSFGMERKGRVEVFYENTLGKYPYLVDKDTPVNGGLPQHTKLDSHLQKSQQDLELALPAPRYLGLGVLHWTEWVPQWTRNTERKTMYLEASRELMKTFFPKWSPEEVEKWSQVRRCLNSHHHLLVRNISYIILII